MRRRHRWVTTLRVARRMVTLAPSPPVAVGRLAGDLRVKTAKHCDLRGPPQLRPLARDGRQQMLRAALGDRVSVRQLRPQDAPALAAAVERLSALSRYRRFHSAATAADRPNDQVLDRRSTTTTTRHWSLWNRDGRDHRRRRPVHPRPGPSGHRGSGCRCHRFLAAARPGHRCYYGDSRDVPYEVVSAPSPATSWRRTTRPSSSRGGWVPDPSPTTGRR